jgi:hypothetical protein
MKVTHRIGSSDTDIECLGEARVKALTLAKEINHKVPIYRLIDGANKHYLGSVLPSQRYPR